MSNSCGICGRKLDQKDDPLSIDCGGDCWGCIGEIEADMGEESSWTRARGEFAEGLRPGWVDTSEKGSAGDDEETTASGQYRPQVAGALGAKMNRKHIQRCIYVAALVIAGAVVWELLLPGSRLAKTVGMIAFGILCIFIRTIPPKFFIPKPKK